MAIVKQKEELIGGTPVSAIEQLRNESSTANKNNTNNTQVTENKTEAQTEPKTTSTKTTSTKSTNSASSQATTSAGFVPSNVVLEANAILEQHNANRPGNYTSLWQDEADAYLNQYQNRDQFSYDLNSDALYQMYRDMYVQQGQTAMMDTMGQVAALSGGYGNSYAQAAGQQSYDQYLSQLNAIVPELAQMARDQYDKEGQEMLAMYDLYMNKENQEYGRYQDELSNWYAEAARLQSNYDNLYNREYGQYRDSVADEQWQKQYNLQKKASRSSSSGNNKPTYKDISVGSDAYNTLLTEIKKADSLPALQDLVNRYLALGYNPDQINAMTSARAAALASSYTTSSTVSGSGYSAGGGYKIYDPDRIK